MVVRNQEAHDALKNYIKTFDITKFPEENVPTACLCPKAVTCTNGDNDLPTNVVHKVLEGFVKSSTPTFNEFCASQIALHHGSFYHTLMNSNFLQSQLNDVLNDLKITYFDLVGGKLWAGVIASPTNSSFVAGSTNDDDIDQTRQWRP